MSDTYARRLWYAKRGVPTDDYNQIDWNMAGAHERQAARDEVDRVMSEHINAQLDAAYRLADVLDATAKALSSQKNGSVER